MGKRQTLTFSKPGITNLYDALDGIVDSMVDMEFVQYLRSLSIPVDYEWDDETETCTVIRTWNEDSDYNVYLSNWGSNRDATETRLEAAGWTITEEVEDL